MTLRLAQFAVAEGATFDARGALALVGFAPVALPVMEFPAQVRLVVITIVEDDRDPEPILLEAGRQPVIMLEVLSPAQVRVFVVQQQIPIAPQQRQLPPQVPHRIQALAQTQFVADEPGVYQFRAEFVLQGAPEVAPIIGTTTLPILRAMDLGQFPGVNPVEA